MSTLARGMRRLGHHAWFARLGRAFTPLDRAIGVRTRGRFVALGLRDLPALVITTIGRKSARPRTNPLLYAREGDAYLVVGTNWGQRHQPDWALNLLANPIALVAVGGSVSKVRASLATGPDRERYWHLLTAIWPPYLTYQERAGARAVMVFRLDPQ